MSVTQQPWFFPTLIIVVLLPLSTFLLTELLTNLNRRNNQLATPVRFLRNYVLPSIALYYLLTQVVQLPSDQRGVKIAASIAGLALITFALSTLKALIFDKNSGADSWRTRTPKIFIDVLRFAIIGIGLSIILQVVWGVNIPGFFEALGLTTVVMALALQGVFGGIVSGLLMQFERPFEVGDYLKLPSSTGFSQKPGRVTNISWRSTTLMINGNSVVIPNEQLSGVSFENLSRPKREHNEEMKATFGVEDAPADVTRVIEETAEDTRMLAPNGSPLIRYSGNGEYTFDIPLVSQPEVKRFKSLFFSRLWYAARRNGLSMDGAPNYFDYLDTHKELLKFYTTLHMDTHDVFVIAPKTKAEQYIHGEIISEPGKYYKNLCLITEGEVALEYVNPEGASYIVTTLTPGDYFGQETLTGQSTPTRVVAIGTVTLIKINERIIGDLLHKKAGLAQDIGRTDELRKQELLEIVKTYGPQTALTARAGKAR